MLFSLVRLLLAYLVTLTLNVCVVLKSFKTFTPLSDLLSSDGCSVVEATDLGFVLLF